MRKSLVFFSILSFPLWGTNYTWNVDADGNWDVPANWNPNTAFPNSTADTATFSTVITVPRTVTVDGVFAVDGLTFNGTIGYTIAALAGDNLNLGGGGSPSNIVLTGPASHLISSPLVLAGNILINQGSSGTLTLSGGVSGVHNVAMQGTGTVILLGTNSYTGTTTILSGTLQAGAANTFAPLSNYTVNGTLDLNGTANTIATLSGSTSGIVNTGGVGGILTITNGSNGAPFSGVIQGSGALVLDAPQLGSLLTLKGVNTYTGTTTITAGTLQLAGNGSITTSSAVTVNGVFDISGIAPATSTSIQTLTGNGIINLGNNTLQISAGSTTFDGVITDGVSSTNGSLTLLSPVSLTLTGQNSYSGTTSINSGASLIAGNPTVFAPLSDYTVNGALNLQTFSNTILDLTGSVSGVVTIGSGANLTITNATGTFAGQITGGGGLALTGGTLTLQGTTNNYSGNTILSNSAILAAGASPAFSPNSAVTLQGSSQLNLSTFSNTIAALSGNTGSIVTLGAGSILTISNGGIFDGKIQGAGALTLSGGTLTLSNQSTYTGTTTISAGTLKLVDAAQLATTDPVVVNGTFDIQGINASTEIGNLSGSGAILLGSKLLIVNETSPTTYSGTIQGVGGSFQKDGASTLTLSGTSSYTGQTNVAAGTLQAGALNTFAPGSLFNISSGATLDLQTFSNTIKDLTGSGIVSIGNGAILTLASASSTYGGQITGAGGLTVSAGTFGLSGTTNNYSGPTLISVNATLNADAINALSSASNVTVNGTLGLNNFDNTINGLFGSGSVLNGGGTLTVLNGGSFSGGIAGSGGLTLTGGTLALSGTTNTYTGQTTVSGTATLQAGANNAFSAASAVQLNGSAILDLNGTNETIQSLASASATSQVKLGPLSTLTISALPSTPATTFAGQLTSPASPNCGGLTLTGGANLTLTGTTNNYCGPTSIVQGTLTIAANGALAPLTDVTVSPAGVLSLTSSANSANSLTNNGIVLNKGALSLANIYTQSAGAVLNLNFQTGAMGNITAVNNITLNGGLIVQATPAFPTTGIFPLLTSTVGIVNGRFSTFTPQGFGAAVPLLSYSLRQVSLYFANCTATWSNPGNGNWGNAANWTPGCVPGANGNTNDVANFNDIIGQTAIQVFLANSTGTAPQSFTLFQLNFNGATTQYTISQFLNGGSLIFDANPAGVPLINVTQGSHFINAPMILNQNTELNLSDGARLTLNPNASLTSATTQDFTVNQVGGIGSGLLVNNVTLTPYSMTIVGASVQNNNMIKPVNALTVGAVAGNTVTVTNAGPNAQMGPTGMNGNTVVGGAGTTSVTNNGAGAIFGPMGAGGSMVVGNTGMTTVLNNGAAAFFGPSGVGGNMTIQGPGVTTVTNTGLGVRMGPSGNGGNLTVSSGTVTNSLGALFRAGPGGLFSITGGTILNDLTSTLGSTAENILFTSGFINDTGNILAFNYTQTAPAILQLNLTSLPTIFGNVAASGTAMVGGSLIVNALPGSVSAGQIADLITAARGVTGTYPLVSFTNFPIGLIPGVVYLPNSVRLEISPTISTNPTGSIGQIPFTSVNEANIRIQRQMYSLHDRLLEKRRRCQQLECCLVPKGVLVAQAESLEGSEEAQMCCSYTPTEECCSSSGVDCNSTRFYIGPTASFGKFDSKGNSQTGFEYNSVGVFTGIDHAFYNWGLGFSLDYTALTGKVDRHAGKFSAHQLHTNAYAAWSPECAPNLAFDTILGWGYDWYEIHRMAGLQLTRTKTKGSPNGMEADALLGAEYIFSGNRFQSMPDCLQITPFVNVQYIWMNIDDYREHHAGIYALKVGHQRAQSLRSTLAIRFDYQFECGAVTFKPELDFGWQYEYLDHSRRIHFSTINLPLTQNISNPIFGAGRNTFWAGVDFLFTVCDIFEVEMSYDYQWNSLYRNNAFYLGVGADY